MGQAKVIPLLPDLDETDVVGPISRFQAVAANDLAPRLRAAYVLRDVEGLPIAEVAATLGMSREPASKYVSRARRELRRAPEPDEQE